MAKLSTVNAIPTMTSNTTPSGEAFTNSINTNGYLAWKAFDKSNSETSMWAIAQNDTLPKHVGYKFTNLKYIGKYTMSYNWVTAGINGSPRGWTFEGSIDGLNYEILDTQSNITWTMGEKKEFEINNNKAFQYYRVNINTDNGRYSGYISITEIEMFEVELEKKVAVENPITLKAYSLSEKTLVHLPSSSSKNIVSHGIEQGKEIQLDVPFTKHNYVNELSVGKVFTQTIGSSNTLKIREIKTNNDYTPVFNWYKTSMTSNTAPAPLVASGSSLFNTNYDYYKPFNETNIDWSDSWTSNNPKAYVQLDFNELKKVNMISITTWNEPNNTASPKRFSISASTNGTEFTTILNETIVSEWTYNTEKIFFLNEDVNYRIFRINVEESFGAAYVSIGKIKFGYKEVN